MRKQALVGYANSKKHKDILDCTQSFFQTKRNDNVLCLTEWQCSNGWLNNEWLRKTKKVEIVWSLKLLHSGFSNNSGRLKNLFRLVLTNLNISVILD